MVNPFPPARLLVKEFAKYRYGVFDEQGYNNDPIYPMCYYDDQNNQAKLTGCSDFPIDDNGYAFSFSPPKAVI